MECIPLPAPTAELMGSNYVLSGAVVNVVIPIKEGTMVYLPFFEEEMDQHAFHVLKFHWMRGLTLSQIKWIRILIRYRFHLGAARYLYVNGNVNEVPCLEANCLHFDTGTRAVPELKGDNIWFVLHDELRKYELTQRDIMYYVWITERTIWDKSIVRMPSGEVVIQPTL